jgi:hypothetical protein
VVAGRYSATGIPDKEYKGWMDLYTKSHSISSRVISQEEKVSLKYHRSKEKKPIPGSQSWADSGSWWTTEPGTIDSGDYGGNE